MNARVINGLAGGTVISDTASHTINANVIKALGGDVVIANATSNLKTPAGADGLASKTLSNGDFLVGIFKQIQLTSGVLVAYLDPTIAQ